MKLKYLKNIVDLTLNRKKCTGCRICVEVCPHDVFIIEDKKARIIDKDACMECGACKLNCPAGAIQVRSGVGCAYAVYNSILTKNKPCCGPADEVEPGCGPADAAEPCCDPADNAGICCGPVKKADAGCCGQTDN
ncbi:MAG: 4Fe-4S binding protein [Spirochaetales bacterium]|nr:4Fe-4S binding protein [Spirochaetales bacterium]